MLHALRVVGSSGFHIPSSDHHRLPPRHVFPRRCRTSRRDALPRVSQGPICPRYDGDIHIQQHSDPTRQHPECSPRAFSGGGCICPSLGPGAPARAGDLHLNRLTTHSRIYHFFKQQIVTFRQCGCRCAAARHPCPVRRTTHRMQPPPKSILLSTSRSSPTCPRRGLAPTTQFTRGLGSRMSRASSAQSVCEQ